MGIKGLRDAAQQSCGTWCKGGFLHQATFQLVTRLPDGHCQPHYNKHMLLLPHCSFSGIRQVVAVFIPCNGIAYLFRGMSESFDWQFINTLRFMFISWFKTYSNKKETFLKTLTGKGDTQPAHSQASLYHTHLVVIRSACSLICRHSFWDGETFFLKNNDCKLRCQSGKTKSQMHDFVSVQYTVILQKCVFQLHRQKETGHYRVKEEEKLQTYRIGKETLLKIVIKHMTTLHTYQK